MSDTSVLTKPSQIGKIEKEQSLSEEDSLIIIKVTDENGFVIRYVTIATHPSNRPVTFSVTEVVTEESAIKVFSRRALFNGRFAYVHSNTKKAILLNAQSIKLI